MTSFTAGALCMLVLGSGSAVAATGGHFLLGRSNSASTTTTLTNSKGTALSLRAPSTKAPLAVSNGVKVPNLNVDRVDGVSAESFARVTGGTGTREVYATTLSLDPASNGRTDTLLAQAACPFGTLLTGGGYDDSTQSGVVVQSSPTPEASMWQVTAVIDPAEDVVRQDLRAWATCYNPKGAVTRQTGDMYTPSSTAKAALTPQLRATVDQRSAR